MAEKKYNDLQLAILAQKPVFIRALVFTFIISLLMLAPSIYMLEVYDRVVNSRNWVTLLMLTLVVILAYGVMESLDWARSRMLWDAGVDFERRLGGTAFKTVFESCVRRLPAVSIQPLQDVRILRDFHSSGSLTGMMDAPAALVFLVALFFIHPLLGVMSIVSALIQALIGYMTEKGTRRHLSDANGASISAYNYAVDGLRNAQVIKGMGMLSGVHARWLQRQNRMLASQAVASDKAGGYAALAKMVQMSAGSLMLGAGCWLLVEGLFTGSSGLLIIASIFGGRVLAPIVQVIGSWKVVVGARDAYARLDSLLNDISLRQPGMPLPPPQGHLSVEGVVAAAPGSNLAVLKGLTFQVPAGKTLAIVGPSASGKSTLAQVMVGVWPAANGKVRLDGVDIHPWNKMELGPYVGYLPQDVELFEGTVAENIARFQVDDMGRVEEVARLVGLHETILALPRGYETDIGEEGCVLSGGQRQRVGLARALYGNPRFVVLDEPNSSLDEQGEQALLDTLQLLKSRGVTVVVVTHRTNALQVADLMLVLFEGQIRFFGPRDEVLMALQRASAQAAAGGSPAPGGASRALPA